MGETDTAKQKAIQDIVKQDKKNCDHVGYFVGFGLELLGVDEKGLINVLTAKNCMMCGETFVTLNQLNSKPQIKQ